MYHWFTKTFKGKILIWFYKISGFCKCITFDETGSRFPGPTCSKQDVIIRDVNRSCVDTVGGCSNYINHAAQQRARTHTHRPLSYYITYPIPSRNDELTCRMEEFSINNNRVSDKVEEEEASVHELCARVT